MSLDSYSSDIEYFTYGNIWEHYNITSIEFQLVGNIFETRLYFEDILYFTRWLTVNELIDTFNVLNKDIPIILKQYLNH